MNNLELVIIGQVVAELERQNELWGTEFDDLNTANDWVAYICRYASDAAYDGREHKYTTERFKEQMLKAAALCIAACNSVDRNGTLAKRHYD